MRAPMSKAITLEGRKGGREGGREGGTEKM